MRNKSCGFCCWCKYCKKIKAIAAISATVDEEEKAKASSSFAGIISERRKVINAAINTTTLFTSVTFGFVYTRTCIRV